MRRLPAATVGAAARRGRRPSPRTSTCAFARWCCCRSRRCDRVAPHARRAGRPERPLAHRRPTVVRASIRTRPCCPRSSRRSPEEGSEFVRPALTRALAAQAADPRARDSARCRSSCAARTSFAGAVIAALGDYDGRYALAEIVDGRAARRPASGRCDHRPRARSATCRCERDAGRPAGRRLPRELQPTISAALCLLGVDCEAHQAYLKQTLTFASATTGYQPLLRGAVTRWACWRRRAGLRRSCALFDAGDAARRDPARAPMALGVGLVALRNPRRAARARSRRAGSRPGGRAAARSVRHAVGGFRGRTVLRRGPARVLGGARRIAAPPRGRSCSIQKLEF